jgi:hypothetical protein
MVLVTLDLNPDQVELIAYAATFFSFTLSAIFGALVIR